ncbi:MAG: response regulator [Chitinophagaceae bacterium]|nr:MAG: response regulator [Chitinophagaceae bacterium]
MGGNAKKILITEDDPAIMDVLTLILTSNNMTVFCYTNGAALLENRFEIPDLFLIDKQLSGVDGLDICRHLKSQDLTRNIPIIVLSASPHVHGQSVEAGADEFLEKPFSNKNLLLTVRKHLEAK